MADHVVSPPTSYNELTERIISGGITANDVMSPRVLSTNEEKPSSLVDHNIPSSPETFTVNNRFGGPPVILKSHQIEHFKRECHILSHNYCSIDNSVMGSGKIGQAQPNFAMRQRGQAIPLLGAWPVEVKVERPASARRHCQQAACAHEGAGF